MTTTIWTKGLLGSDKSATIKSFAVAGYPVRPAEDDTVLHWHLDLQLTDISSVVVDMAVGGDGSTGLLMFTSVTDASIPLGYTSYRFSPVKTITVGEFMDVLLSRKRDRYRYDDTGSGCRYWCIVAITDLQAEGVLDNEASSLLENYFVAQNEENPVRTPMPTRRGEFY